METGPLPAPNGFLTSASYDDMDGAVGDRAGQRRAVTRPPVSGLSSRSGNREIPAGSSIDRWRRTGYAAIAPHLIRP